LNPTPRRRRRVSSPCKEIISMFSIPLPFVTLVLAKRWGLSDARIQALAGGMTSAVWAVDDGEGRWVAKAVPAEVADEFAAGLEIAARLEQAGFAAGAPRPTLDGQITVSVGDWVLALLRRVEGTELTGETDDGIPARRTLPFNRGFVLRSRRGSRGLNGLVWRR